MTQRLQQWKNGLRERRSRLAEERVRLETLIADDEQRIAGLGDVDGTRGVVSLLEREVSELEKKGQRCEKEYLQLKESYEAVLHARAERERKEAKRQLDELETKVHQLKLHEDLLLLREAGEYLNAELVKCSPAEIQSMLESCAAEIVKERGGIHTALNEARDKVIETSASKARILDLEQKIRQLENEFEEEARMLRQEHDVADTVIAAVRKFPAEAAKESAGCLTLWKDDALLEREWGVLTDVAKEFVNGC